MIYSTIGMVMWLIKHVAKSSALSDMRPLLECCRLCTVHLVLYQLLNHSSYVVHVNHELHDQVHALTGLL